MRGKYLLILLTLIILGSFVRVDSSVSSGRVKIIARPQVNPTVITKPSEPFPTPEPVVGSVDVGMINRTEVSEKELKEYREALNISKVAMGKVRVVVKLNERKKTDQESFESITKLSRIAEEDEREIIAEELLEMDKKFVERFSQEQERPEVQEQVRNYASMVREKRRPRIIITKEKIQDLFSRKITIDDLLDQIWDEIR